jgi:hypothetical protein
MCLSDQSPENRKLPAEASQLLLITQHLLSRQRKNSPVGGPLSLDQGFIVRLSVSMLYGHGYFAHRDTQCA